MRRFWPALALAAAVAAPLPAAAQEGVDWGGLMAGIAHGTAMDEAAQESVTSNRRGARTAPTGAGLTYRPSIERRRANFAGFVAKTRAKDPEGAALLERELASSDVIAKMGSELAPFGMRVDNVGDAYAIWWLNAWLASRQRADTPPRRQIEAVRAQAGRAMASVAGLASASDAEKQELAEASLIQAMLIGAYIEQAKNDPALFGKVAEAARQAARTAGLDLDAMDLSDDGFVPRRVGATEPATRRAAAAVEATSPATGAREAGDSQAIGAAVAAGIIGLVGAAWLVQRRKARG